MSRITGVYVYGALTLAMMFTFAIWRDLPVAAVAAGASAGFAYLAESFAAMQQVECDVERYEGTLECLERLEKPRLAAFWLSLISYGAGAAMIFWSLF
ncbi:MAG: hypothetical protein GY942_18615 [Aestuariibacter sp.]|nr:hypothetical protein [Aestuariibacter sp.]